MLNKVQEKVLSVVFLGCLVAWLEVSWEEVQMNQLQMRDLITRLFPLICYFIIAFFFPVIGIVIRFILRGFEPKWKPVVVSVHGTCSMFMLADTSYMSSPSLMTESFKMLSCTLDVVTFNTIALTLSFHVMNLDLNGTFPPCSPLQIFGLIFFSRKRKKERRGSWQEARVNPWMIHLIRVQILILLLHNFPISGLVLDQHQLVHLLIRTWALSLVDIFSMVNKLVLSSQLFLLQQQIAKHLVHTVFLDTEYTFFEI